MKKSKKYYYYFDFIPNTNEVVCKKALFKKNDFHGFPLNFEDAYADSLISHLNYQLQSDILFEYGFEEKWDDPYLDYFLNNKIKIIKVKW